MSKMKDVVWCDLESTGLLDGNPGGAFADGQILEWALATTDDDLTPRLEWTGVVLHDVDTLHMSPFAFDMHTKSGLLSKVPVAADDTSATDAKLASWAADRRAEIGGDKLTLAGNTVHFDLQWIRLRTPKFAAHLSHRVFDVSTLQRAGLLWVPGYERLNANAHTALVDVRDSIEACRLWRKAVGL